ncbi:hypothetical protein ACN38_g10130 [Penicillium nordicum]|uniref:Uncharacterized protein n=1 Tax=Penicillium nordicum TaxID=229535 RepID=A0A0M8P0Z0_9EURO|nr:hypothetical protein ACN38_g10130 [Penicillium nordicum]
MGCRSEDFNDEDGKLGDDGRKRRSWGSSDDEGPLTHDNLLNEDLRVGGPYLCSIPTASVVVPKNHVKFRLTCLETDEGWELGQKILNIIDKYHLNQRGIGVMFYFFSRQSIIDPEPDPCLTLYVPAKRGTVDDTWLQCARELRGVLISNDLASCSVKIVDPMVFTPAGRKGISIGLVEGLLGNDSRTMATESIASSRNYDSSSTLGCFLSLKYPSSDEWRTFALTCWYVVVPLFAGLSDGDKKLIENWNKNGIPTSTIANTVIYRLLGVDHPTRLAYGEEVSMREKVIEEIEGQKKYQMCQQLERDDALEMLSGHARRHYENLESNINKQKDDLQTLHDRSENGHRLLGRFFCLWFQAQGPWPYDVLRPSTPLNPESFAPRSILQSLEVHGDEVFMHGYRSGERIGLYNGLRVANIEAKMKEGVVTTAITLDYSITGLEGENFSARGDSRAMVSYKRRTSTGNESVIIGMVFAGLEKEGITSFTRADFLLDDIKEMTKARDIELELFWFS